MTSLIYNRRGFTFTEVMFAVILLGIGFIMLAGMFPVAIQQTQTNVEESTASEVVQIATRYLEQSLTQADLPPTGNLNPPSGTAIYPQFLRLSQTCNASNGIWADDYHLWDKARGGFVLPQDPRFAWTALYKRNPGDNFAHVILFACQARNYSNYTINDTMQYTLADSSPPLQLAAFEPRYLYAILSDGGAPGVPDMVEFPATTTNEKLLRSGLAEGGFIVVADDRVPADDGGTPWFDPGYANGRIYRLGNRRPDLDGKLMDKTAEVWELMPGHDMQSPEENIPLRKSPHGSPQSTTDYMDHQNSISAQVFFIGRGFVDSQPNTLDTHLSGFAQDIAVYTTFIRLK